MALTPKKEKFVYAYIDCRNATAAYRRAFDCKKMKPQSVQAAASKTFHDPDVQAKLAELGKKAAETAVVTIEGHLEELASIRDGARVFGQYSAAVTAEVNRGKASGLYVESLELSGKGGKPLSVSLNVNFVKPKDDDGNTGTDS